MRTRLIRAGLAMLIAGVSLQLVTLAPASAVGSLSGVSWSISRPLPADTNVRYTWSFTTATTATLTDVQFSVPAGTTAPGGLTVVDVYGLPAGGTATLNSGVVTYTFAPTSVSAGVSALVALDGFTNDVAGSYTSTVTTLDAGGLPGIDAGTSPAVTIATNTTSVRVVVARSASFTTDTTSFTLLMDASSASLSDVSKLVTLTARTNAGNGYTLNMGASALSGGGFTIGTVTPDKTTGVATGSFTADKWGYAIGAIGGDAVGTIQGAPLSGGQYVGYVAGAGGESVVASNGPTNGDTIPVTNRVKVDYKQPAATYNGTITYTMTESY